jgi:hypothetical protein
MNHPILILIAILASCAWCLFVDADDSATAGTNNFFLVMCRVIARHIKLFFRVVLGVGITFVAIMSCFEIGALVSHKAVTKVVEVADPETERFSHFMNEATWAVQMVLDGFTTILGILAACTLLFFEKFCHWYLAHARVCSLALLAFYLIWLVYNMWKITDEIYDHRDTAILCTSLALALCIGTEVAVVIHLWRVLTGIHQAVVANIYS